MSALTPVGGAESEDGEGQSQTGQGQGEQGARAAGQTLQHGHAEEEGGTDTPARERRGEEREGKAERRRKGENTRGSGARGNGCSHRWGRAFGTDALGWF